MADYKCVIKSVNVKTGTVYFNNSNNAVVTFSSPFTTVPVVIITLNDLSLDVPYKLNVTTNYWHNENFGL